MQTNLFNIGAISKVIEENSHLYGGNDFAFLQRVYAEGIDKYVNRLEQYGFKDLGHVLDAGCGFGQWAISLAMLNRQVTGTDVAPERLLLLGMLLEEMKVKNVSLKHGVLTKLPLEDSSCDGVFCYGTLFVTAWRDSLRELIRVLRPGGLLYVNYNGPGFYRYLWNTAHNSADGYDPRYHAAFVWLNTYNYDVGKEPAPGHHVLINGEELLESVDSLGCSVIEHTDEGCAQVDKSASVGTQSFFQGQYYGDVGVRELLARKRT